jgi:hypothetical protein
MSTPEIIGFRRLLDGLSLPKCNLVGDQVPCQPITVSSLVYIAKR